MFPSLKKGPEKLNPQKAGKWLPGAGVRTGTGCQQVAHEGTFWG